MKELIHSAIAILETKGFHYLGKTTAYIRVDMDGFSFHFTYDDDFDGYKYPVIDFTDANDLLAKVLAFPDREARERNALMRALSENKELAAKMTSPFAIAYRAEVTALLEKQVKNIIEKM